MTQARAFGGAFDQARHVCNDKTLLRRDAHHAQVRVERSEWIVGDLRPGIGRRGNEGGLSGVGHAKQSDIGQNAKLKAQFAMRAGPASSLLPRRPVRTALEVQVSKPTVAALDDLHLCVRRQQFSNRLTGFRVADDGAHGHAQDDVCGCCAKLVRAPTAFSVARDVLARVAEVDERIEVSIPYRIDTAATTTVTAVWPAEWNEFLAAKTHAAAAAVSGGDFDGRLVDKFHDFCHPYVVGAFTHSPGRSIHLWLPKKQSPGMPGLEPARPAAARPPEH